MEAVKHRDERSKPVFVARQVLNAITKKRYREKLTTLVPIEAMPTAEDESQNPAAADTVYESCGQFLRAKTRKKDDYPLVSAKNVEYGFRRNCLGLRTPAIWLGAMCLLAGIVLALAGAPLGAHVRALAAATGIANCLLLMWWTKTVNGSRDTSWSAAGSFWSPCLRWRGPGYAAGQPRASTPPVGSFEHWTEVVAGILQYAGVEGFLANSEALFEQSDTERSDWETFLEALEDVFTGAAFTIAELWERLNEKTYEELIRRSVLTDRAEELRATVPGDLTRSMDREGQFKQRVGIAFNGKRGQRFGKRQLRVERVANDGHAKVARWRIVANA